MHLTGCGRGGSGRGVDRSGADHEEGPAKRDSFAGEIRVRVGRCAILSACSRNVFDQTCSGVDQSRLALCLRHANALKRAPPPEKREAFTADPDHLRARSGHLLGRSGNAFPTMQVSRTARREAFLVNRRHAPVDAARR